jgi:asparagine N-glycosylation enzyme membrane subunit Stt3
LLGKWTSDRKLEVAFIAFFSALIIVLFYTLVSMNGLVLGNDPAVHLAKAQIFLKTGHIPLNAVGWIPPLFEIMLAMVISFSGASNVGQLIFLVKALAVIADWLLFLSVYLVGSKFFNKKIGSLAAVFLSMCYPMYELNTWGGYTTVLGIDFLLLLFYYSYLAAKQFGYVAATFFIAFAIVLNNQITAFLAVVIMLPVMFLMLIKFKGAYLKGFVAIILGGAIAFFAYYFQAIVNYLDIVIYHVFFGNKAYILQIPYTNFQSFLLYFGFIQFLAIGGIGISYYLLKRQKKLILFVTLMLSLFVPLFFAESYVFGFLLPFEWFTYYLAPPIVILAAVCVVFIAEELSAYFKNRHSLHKDWLKIAAISLIVLVSCPIIVFHVDNTYRRIMLAAAFNSTSDINAYDAAVWLNQSYPGASTVVVTKNPGDWFAIFSGKHVISQTHDWEGRNAIADSVLNLDYEIEGSQTLVKAYETNGYTTDENYVSINQIWYRVSFSSIAGDFLSFNQNGANYHYVLSDLSRTISFDDQSNPKEIEFRYFNNQVALTQTILVQNDSYPINVSWSISPLNGDISNVTLYLTTYFDLHFQFDKAQIPQLMNWVNPWDMPSKTTKGKEWATVNFSDSDMVDHYIGLYDQQNQTAFAFYFTDLPDWGNIGALANHQIDAVRYRYNFNQIGANQTVMRRYQVLTLTKNSYPTLQPDELQSLFNFKFDQFPVLIHDYKEYIAENNIGFIVYDKNQIDGHTGLPLGSSFLPQLAQCQFLELVYSNSRYDVFKIVGNYTQTQVWN